MKSYSISEIAELLNKSRQWIWALIQMKKIKAVKIGNQYVITDEQLNKFLQKKEMEKK
jgi:excisionase family DNA binding protein